MKPFCFHLACLLLGAMGCLLSFHATRADEWEPHRTEFKSNNGQYLLNVTSQLKDGKLTLSKKTVEGGKEELWSRPFVDEYWPPYRVYVADDGQHVVLRDLHYQLGWGKVLVFLGSKGEVLKSYELDDLLYPDQILHTVKSSSSTWWSVPGWFSFMKDQRLFAFATYHGAIQCFDVATGEPCAVDGNIRSEIRERATQEYLPLLKDEDYFHRLDAVRMCGGLKATQAVPDLKRLLDDKTPGAFTFFPPDSRQDLCIASANALIAILSDEAVPLIEEQLVKVTHWTRKELLDAIKDLDGDDIAKEKADPEYLLKTWHRLSESKLEDVRKLAHQEVLRREKAQYVYDRPELLNSQDTTVRSLAARLLAEDGDERIVSLLRSAMDDQDALPRLWAIRGIIKFPPEDILDLLQRGIEDKDAGVRREALAELIRRGDDDVREMRDAFFDDIAKLAHHTHEKEGYASEEYDAREICELVIKYKLSAAEPALRKAYKNDCERIRRPISAALASFGDKEALAELRQFMQPDKSGDRDDPLRRSRFIHQSIDRIISIRLIGLIGDTESIPTLEEMLNDREIVWIREEIKETIDILQKKKAENAKKE